MRSLLFGIIVGAIGSTGGIYYYGNMEIAGKSFGRVQVSEDEHLTTAEAELEPEASASAADTAEAVISLGVVQELKSNALKETAVDPADIIFSEGEAGTVRSFQFTDDSQNIVAEGTIEYRILGEHPNEHIAWGYSLTATNLGECDGRSNLRFNLELKGTDDRAVFEDLDPPFEHSAGLDQNETKNDYKLVSVARTEKWTWISTDARAQLICF